MKRLVGTPSVCRQRCAFRCQAGAKQGGLSALLPAQQLLKTRLEETQRERPLLKDTYADALLHEAELAQLCEWDSRCQGQRAADAVVTRLLDDALLEATSLVIPDRGDYNQVVLVSPGLDTRPFRLPWRKGVVIYDVASSEIHALRQERLQQRAPHGSLHIPVPVQSVSEMIEELQKRGFRGDRLSVWAIQGLHLMEWSREQLESLFVQISQLSMSKSLILGELPDMDASSSIEFLAQFSLFAVATPLSDAAKALNRSIQSEERCLFRAQQRLHSLREREIYAAHVQAAEETDEDFLDNFS